MNEAPANIDRPSRLSADAWLTPGRFALVLAGLIAAFFPDVLLAGKSFVFRDFGIFTYPVAYYQRESFWHGELPLWNPLNNCGIPFLAQWNTAVLYPLSLSYILLPLARGLNLYFLIHLFLAGFGMYWLAARWTGNRFAAAVAGIALVFNGMTLNCLMWASNVAALAWMPWVILAVESAWREGGRRIILAAFVGAVQMLSGAPEIILFTWLLLFLLWAGQAVGEKGRRRLFSLRFSMVVLLVGGLSAVQLLPFLDLLRHSDRSSALGASFWAIPPSGWANLLVPLFHCYRSPAGVYFQPGQDWTSSYYPGIGILALGLSAVVLVRTPRVWLLTAAAVLGFVTAMGDPGRLYPGLLKIFPPLGFMRYPIKFEFLTAFALPLLAAFAIAGLSPASPVARAKAARWIWLLASVLAATMGALVWYSRAHPLPGEPWQTAGLNGLARVFFLLLILAVSLRYARSRQLRQQVFTGLLLLVLLWLDVATHAPRQNPTVAASAYQPGLLPQRLNINPQPGNARAFLERQAHDQVYGWMLPDPYQDYLGRRTALLGDCNLLDGLPTAAGFFSLYVREQPAIFSALFNSTTNHFPSGLADFVGIAWLSNPAQLSDWRFRPSARPVCTLGPKPVFAEPAQMPALLSEPDFDARKIVYLAPETKAWLTVTNPARGTVRIVQFAAEHQVFETEAGTAALLVLAQTYYHPWRAYVDDQPARLWQANYAFQALEVPAGTHRVVLRYEDWSFRSGAIISLLTVIGGGVFVFRHRPRSKR